MRSGRLADLVASGFGHGGTLNGVGVNPRCDCFEYGPERGRQLCCLVLHSWGYLVVLGSLDQTVPLEFSELAGQRGRGDGLKPFHEFVEAGLAISRQGAEDSELPSPTDHTCEAGHVAHGRVRCVIRHDPPLSSISTIVDTSTLPVPS